MPDLGSGQAVGASLAVDAGHKTIEGDRCNDGFGHRRNPS